MIMMIEMRVGSRSGDDCIGCKYLVVVNFHVHESAEWANSFKRAPTCTIDMLHPN